MTDSPKVKRGKPELGESKESKVRKALLEKSRRLAASLEGYAEGYGDGYAAAIREMSQAWRR